MRIFAISLLLILLGGPAHADPQDKGVGLWWVAHGDGRPLQMRLYPNGTCWSDDPANNPGRWSVQGSALVCLWADGWKERLLFEDGRWVKYGYTPDTPLSASPSNRSWAIRVSHRPDGWLGFPPPELQGAEAAGLQP